MNILVLNAKDMMHLSHDQVIKHAEKASDKSSKLSQKPVARA
jgi:hypothetical protein